MERIDQLESQVNTLQSCLQDVYQKIIGPVKHKILKTEKSLNFSGTILILKSNYVAVIQRQALAET